MLLTLFYDSLMLRLSLSYLVRMWSTTMNVLLLKDVAQVGKEGQIIKVSEGYARNYLFPKKLAVHATTDHIQRAQDIEKKVGEEIAVHGARIMAFAESISRLNIVLKLKANDKGRLYGALNSDDIVELLKERNIVVNKKQIEFDKAIRSVGDYFVTIRLNSKLRPALKISIKAITDEGA